MAAIMQRGSPADEVLTQPVQLRCQLLYVLWFHGFKWPFLKKVSILDESRKETMQLLFRISSSADLDPMPFPGSSDESEVSIAL